MVKYQPKLYENRRFHMDIINELEWTFDTVASIYEKVRPGYVDSLYQKIFNFINIDGASNVVEIGIGGAQATLPILQRGCKLTAVECGKHFSELCKEKFKNYPTFSVITSKFEDVNFESDTYDFIFAASAFHWIPEEIGYKKVFSMLKSGGAFAQFANHPFRDKGRKELSDEIQKLYCKYMNFSTAPNEYNEKMAEQKANLAYAYGFKDIKYHLFKRTRTFSAKEYVTLLGTYSDHISLEEKKRKEFFSKIEETIDKYGGKITIYDTIDLELARKL